MTEIQDFGRFLCLSQMKLIPDKCLEAFYKKS